MTEPETFGRVIETLDDLHSLPTGTFVVDYKGNLYTNRHGSWEGSWAFENQVGWFPAQMERRLPFRLLNPLPTF